MAPKRARPSPVWDFMEKVSPTLVKCLVCNSHLSYNKCTSTMMKHLKTKHPIEFHGSHQNTPPQPTGTTINITDNGHGQQAEQGQVEAPEVGVQPFIQPMLRDVISKREVYKEGGHKKKQLDDLVVKMIMKDLQPLSVVEDEGFRELVAALDSRYTLPSHRELSAMKNSEEVRHVREKMKAIVTFFHHSVKASDKLADVQEEKGFHKKKLITDVDTSDELETVKSAVQVLEPFQEATREMSSEKFTTLSKIIPLIRTLQDCTVSRKANIFSLCDELQKQFAKKFTGMEANFHIAAGTLLDPRFKKVSFSDIGNSKRIEERLINIMKAAIDDQETQLTSSTAETHQETQTQDRKKTLWKMFDEKVERTVKVGQSYSAGPHIDMRRYLEEPLIPREGDPMTWWKDHSPLFPKLAEQAKKFLFLPTHSTPPISTPTPHLTSPIPPYPSLTLHIPTPISSPSPLHQPSPLIPYPTITSLSPPHSNSLTSHHPQPIPPPPHLISPHLTLPTPPLHPSHLPTVTLSPLTILNLFHHHLTLFHLTSHPLPHHYIPLTSSLHTTPPCYLTQFV
ncbi:hypothetical protein Pcinc_019232 [Petrolisthes cinctipes]|uniref:BED-type domain-containing protein n=1 Tax=Petrolisthes cinctipes TaxID=88211 RepID=A0AAE1KKQ3_PETCI|nr:hypothetical protein Pcinc_019232 [Petrolisthes cinctipes]